MILAAAALAIASLALGLAVSSAIQARDAARFWTKMLATRIENLEAPTTAELSASASPGDSDVDGEVGGEQGES